MKRSFAFMLVLLALVVVTPQLNAETIANVQADTRPAIIAVNPAANGSGNFGDLLIPDVFSFTTTAGAVFTADLTLSGTTNDGNPTFRVNEGNGSIIFDRVQVNGAGNSVAENRTATISFTVSDIEETTSTGATAVFDGFESLTIVNFNPGSPASESATFDGVSIPAAAGGVVTLASLAPNGSVLVDTTPLTTTDGFFVLNGINAQFTVTAVAVPEPSSAVLTASLFGLGFLRRRRRA